MAGRKPIVTPESAKAFRKRLDETAKRFGEIKSDNSNWYERRIVQPFTTWLNTRPGGPVVTGLKAASSFIPGVGEVIDMAEGNPGWAAVGAIPLVGDAVQVGRRVVKDVGNVVDVLQAADNLGINPILPTSVGGPVKKATDYISDYDVFAGPEDWGVVNEMRRHVENIDPNSIPFKCGGVLKFKK